MKPPYCVSTINLGEELRGQTPIPGKSTDFENIEQARIFAEAQKDKWYEVNIFKRDVKGELEKIEYYLKGQLYIGNKKVKKK